LATTASYSSCDKETEGDDDTGAEYAKHGPSNIPSASQIDSHLLARGIMRDPLSESVGKKGPNGRKDIRGRDSGNPRSQEEDGREGDSRDYCRKLRNLLDAELPGDVLEKLLHVLAS
jgi:hypothetical protein